MDVSRAQLSNTGNEVVLIDPGWPFIVRAQVDGTTDRPALKSLALESRDGRPITATALSQLPLRQITHVAVSATAGEGEAQYRMLARPRPNGQRSWSQDHFQRVARVASWARSTGRPGGAAGAVAEFWGVHLRTARRWLSRVQGQA